ncbi:sensor domain-containing diguanylate cyclase [Mesorhizobium sp. CU2]|uniref:sensor domain-containing diguanylate cyclase n=1 Tax=unclassified Mesorhizobium TaxID=325217 RepID=UPI001128B9B9|nr:MULTISPECIES: sensor domain-containing diguanylate cyclase [unclassified Mesorhizobium]TPN89707.1 sensor domain-containing diguanylate cyclase [Mesorhizobium sp. CU3]TPO21395.1 sensor domain-containing diguanylate cyclase [Mesorhizobium sp. CU2]
MQHDGVSASTVGQGVYQDERLDALLSITGRMDGYLYRCRNDASYTMLYISDGIFTVSGYRPSDFIQNAVRDYVSAIHPDDLASVYAAVDAALEARRNWNIDYRIVPAIGEPLWVREIGGGVWDSAGELEFLEGFVVDISDRKVVEDLNAQLLLDLKVANEELSAQKREIELAKQQSDHSAHHDQLTDLPNRRAFHNELKSVLARCAGSGDAAGLLFIDLDRFKDVNDTLGHEAGDALLQRVSNHLRSVLRSDDFVARLGGDEFAFLFSGKAEQAREKAVRVAERVLERLRIKVPALGGDIQVGCTVGVAIYPTEATDPDALVALADRLMYVGKKNGRGQLVTADALEPPTGGHRRTA